MHTVSESKNLQQYITTPWWDEENKTQALLQSTEKTLSWAKDITTYGIIYTGKLSYMLENSSKLVDSVESVRPKQGWINFYSSFIAASLNNPI